MTDHPAKGMTRAQREAFEHIAVGQHPFCRPETVAALVHSGLVNKVVRRVGRDRFGPIDVPEYSVPFDIHRQWCEWCSEQPDTVSA